MKRKYGLIGFPLSHSFSPSYFAKKFKREGIHAEYKAYEIEDVSAVEAILESGVEGLNVTIPHKEKVIPLLDSLDIASETIGAVNTIKKVGGKLYGFNTDVFGFQQSLSRLELPFSLIDSKALILGSGGASKAIKYVLQSLGAICTTVSRTLKTGADITYPTFRTDMLGDYNIIVNTTPLGTYPNEQDMPPIPYWDINSKQLVYDLIYNPEKTLLLKRADERNAIIKNGAEMLVLQAEKSWEIWNT